MEVQQRNTKWSRGFLSNLNRSFRLSHGKSRMEGVAKENCTNMTQNGIQNAPSSPVGAIRPLEYVAPRIDTYRFSMANLEETQDADLDAILGELCALDTEYDDEISRCAGGYANSKPGKESVSVEASVNNGVSPNRSSTQRTHSPDNDSAFSDTVSMLSGESSASSGASPKCKALQLNLQQSEKDASCQQKADKIKLALERMREANIKKLFIKAFSTDGSSKSLLVDEKMNCGYVARLLAEKNHVSMEPKWALVEQLPDLHMERIYEDHELLVDNLMLWTRESKNKIIFAERPDKISLFQTPEKYLLPEDDRDRISEQDEHSRHVIIEEFFGPPGNTNVSPSIVGHPVPAVEGPLYLKSESKKGWKKLHFVLRPSGVYYFPKEKTKTLKELVCLASFDNNEVYLGVNWRKKYKSPTDYCFAIKHPRLQQPKSIKFIKFLCADDQQTLDRWIVAMRIAKHGRRLLENHRSLVEELAQEDLDHLAHARSCSISSIPNKANRNSVLPAISPASQSTSSNASVINSDISSGRHSRASSSSSSGCLSDAGAASETTFDSEFPMGTIKRKPSMKPNIPLTWMTRQLKEMAEKDADGEGDADGGTLTRRPRRHARPEDSGTLKRHNARDTCDSNIYSVNGHPTSIMSTNSESSSYSHYEALSRDSYRNSSENGFRSSSENGFRNSSENGFRNSSEHSFRNSSENSFRNSSENGSSLYGGKGSESFRNSSEHGSSLYGYTGNLNENDNIEDLPLPPPPIGRTPEAIYSSTLSLESLPPPPPPIDMMLQELSGSQLSLPPPPPEHTLEPQPGRVQDIVAQLKHQPVVQCAPFPRQPSLDSVSSGNSRSSGQSIYAQPSAAYGVCINEMVKNVSIPATPKREVEDKKFERCGSIKKVAFADEPVDAGSVKKIKKISFATDERPISPRKPPPPKRSESTRLSSPKKLVDSESNPPKDFLKDLQRVMRKKWQVAQKCKSDSTTTPHEVLGFREFPLLEDYKENSVSMWVQEHYGGRNEDLYGSGGCRRSSKRPPPTPPRRSDTTQLTTHHPNQIQPSAS